jgi:hypothetical protein
MSNNSTYGLVIKKTPTGAAAKQEEVIVHPKPAFIDPPKALVFPTKRDTTPAKSLSELGMGKLFLPKFGSDLDKPAKVKKEKVAKEKIEKVAKQKGTPAVPGPTDPFMGVVFTEAHILSDVEFIKATRAPFNIHSKGAKALFFANGGAAYLGHSTLQGSFEAMRQNILAKLAGLTAGEPYKRVGTKLIGEHHVFNKGTYEQAQLLRTRAYEVARIREENYNWLNAPLRKVG